jgi:hypothetical protein
MAKVQTLSAEFIDELAWTIGQVKRLVKGSLQDAEKDLRNAPDDIMAWIPEGGIPARSGLTATGVLCNLYRIVDTDPSDDTITLELLADGNGDPLQRKVFNIYPVAVVEYCFSPTARLKSGHRYAAGWPCDSEGAEVIE